MSDSLLRHLRICARYNTRANRRLYDVCAALPEPELRRRRPAFLKSILGTLNHILIGDRIWLGRFAGREMPSSGLDAILHDDLADLRADRSTTC